MTLNDVITTNTSADIQLLSIDTLLPAHSPRLNGDDPDHVRVLAGLQTQLPPILVHRATMRIIDGAHRVAAARLRGDTEIRSRFFDGDEQEAFALAVHANITHGLPLTHADRVAAATTIITTHPAWSDRAVAATAGLSATTVANIRRTTSDHAAPIRTGRDGRTRPVDPGAGRERVRQMIRKSPDASLRQLAKEAGVSPNTVRRIRKQLQAEPPPEPVREEPVALVPADAQKPTAPNPTVQNPTVPNPIVQKPIVQKPTVDTALRWLSQDPSVRLTESGRSAARWFFARVVRPDEWKDVVDGLPPHTAHMLAKVARQCATAWEDLASNLTARAGQLERQADVDPTGTGG